jgi:1-deoxy-D-xylulose-5-phosphate reductoisomerase
MPTLAILGSTGSIGTQTLDVARWHGYPILGLSAGRNAALLVEQAREFRPRLVACAADVAAEVRPHLPAGTRLATGPEGSAEVATLEADRVVAAIPGMAGLGPTVAALRAGRHVALANKEAMVVAGPLIWQEARAAGGSITPVDSEHSGLFQALVGEPLDGVASLVLTASGGPFRDRPDDLSEVTPAQALAHPNWAMGPKVTIDSATLFNKGLEVLEAHFLFDVPLEAIEVVLHPQSLIHALVRFRDGSIKAQIGPHDMRLPIQHALTAPARIDIPLEPLPLLGTWELREPDHDRFPSLGHAYEAGRRGGLVPTALNAADEVAVAAFLDGGIPFTDIPRLLERALHAPIGELAWDQLDAADREARSEARSWVATRRGR